LTMPRFFLPPEKASSLKGSIKGSTIDLDGPVAHQVARVLRLRPGDSIVLLDGEGSARVVELTHVVMKGGSPRVLGVVTGDEKAPPNVEPSVTVVLYQGLPKGDKMDLIVQKCTEVGVGGIVPVVSRRTVARPEGSRLLERVERWRKIAREAAEQSGRLTVPCIMPAVALAECPLELGDERRPPGPDEEEVSLVLWEREESNGPSALRLGGALERSGARRFNLFVGPEGGFSEDEIDLLRSRGAVTVSLGSRILRTETAGPIGVALILHHFGDLG